MLGHRLAYSYPDKSAQLLTCANGLQHFTASEPWDLHSLVHGEFPRIRKSVPRFCSIHLLRPRGQLKDLASPLVASAEDA